jgi:hypothetical protein
MTTSDDEHTHNKTMWKISTRSIWEYFITSKTITREVLAKLTNDITVPNLKGRTFEDSTGTNVTTEDLAYSIIQMYQHTSTEKMSKSSARRMEGFIYIIMKIEKGSEEYEYGPSEGRKQRIYDKALIEVLKP